MISSEPNPLETLLSLLDAERPLVAAHSRRVATYAVRLAAQYGVSPRALEAVRVGALLHDVGKLAVPSRILEKSGRLSSREHRELEIHPQVGVELVNRLGVEHEVCQIILYHHERWDGGGYPDRLAGRDIDWAARIVSVADVFDALTSAREHQQPLSTAAARARIVRGAGKQFCPWIVSALLSLPDSVLDSTSADSRPGFQPDGCVRPNALAATRAWVFRP